MHLSLAALLPFAARVLATVNGHCSGSASGLYLSDGICVTTSTCDSYDGSYISGGCPYDADNVKCCLVGLEDSVSVNPCGGSSYCNWVANGCSDGSWISGTFFPEGLRVAGLTRLDVPTGDCPGGSNYKCCKH
jgi:hypothetical protein